MPNALAQEKSPYLRQHQTNPVQWLPWGDEVFTRAQAEAKPILLSIGYAACHWCHVMAHESFEDEDTAALMNEHFINVKVDREERPDVDAVYVRALQAMGKRAGWPLTMFLTATGKPFWGGTYFPPVARGQQPGFRDVLTRVSEVFRADPANAEARAGEIVTAITREANQALDAASIGRKQTIAVAEELLRSFDMQNGGLTGAPKFPYPALLRFLWNVGVRERRSEMQDAVALTLTCMVRGGIFDQLGGGFARYSTDAEWRVPHFEKMLYDNALLVHLLTDVSRTGPIRELEVAVERTIEWLLREMRLPGGAFACSLDADSGDEGEGAFYLWQEEEIDALLGGQSELFKRAYGVTREGNFEHRNVLHRLDAADLSDLDERVLSKCRAVLFEVRARRSAPPRDEKVLADWNGLAIAALARAGAVFAHPAWIDAARAAFHFLMANMTRNDELCHSWCDGVLAQGSILDDHANMAYAALFLYEATSERTYLERCESIVARAESHFSDAAHGAFYLTAAGERSLVARIRDGLDGATPSGNGVMAHVLARLHYMTGAEHYRERAEKVIAAFAGEAERESFRLATLLDASAFVESGVHIVITGSSDDAAVDALIRAALRDNGPDNIVRREHRPNGRAQASVCAGRICWPPAFDADALRERLSTYKEIEEE